MTDIKLTPANAGCWVDGHWGWRGILRVIEIAQNYGMQTTEDEQRAIDAYDNDDSDPESCYPEIVNDIEDTAVRWLNDYLAPEGHLFGWFEGEFYLWSRSDWGDEDDEGVLSERATRQERGVVGWEGDDDLDTQSSASRQHYIDTGRHLRHGEALDSDDEDVCASSDPYYCDGKCR